MTFAQQSRAFLLSFVLGAGLGVLYGLIRFLRVLLKPSKFAVTVLDVSFMLIWSLAVFFFSLAYLSGYVRFYVILGSLGGFLLYRSSVGHIIVRLYSPVIRSLRTALQKIREKLKFFAKNLLKIAYGIMYNIYIKKGSIKKRRNKRQRNKDEFEKTKNKKGFFRGKDHGKG